MSDKKNLPVVALPDAQGQMMEIPLNRLVNGLSSIARLTRPAPPGFKANFYAVKADLREMKDGGDLYKISQSKVGNEWIPVYGVSSRFLAECRAASGIQCVSSVPVEMEDIAGRGPGVRVSVMAILPSLIGADRVATSTVQMSYLDAFERYGKRDRKTGELTMGDEDRSRERSMMPRKLETMAKSRVTAELLNLKRAYRKDQLEGGLFAFVQYELDTSDPDTRRIAIDRMTTAHHRLMGVQQPAEPMLEGPAETVQGGAGELQDVELESEVADWSEPYDLGSAEVVDDNEAAEAASVRENDPPGGKVGPEGGGRPAGGGSGGGQDDDESERLPGSCPFNDQPMLVSAFLRARTKAHYHTILDEIDGLQLQIWLASWIAAVEYDTENDPGKVLKVWEANADNPTPAVVEMAKWWKKGAVS